MSDHSESHHHHHHGRKKSLVHRIKSKLKRKKWILPSVLLVTAALIAGALWMVYDVNSEAQRQVTAGKQFNAGSGYRDITYNGNQYRYNSRITTILYAGVDSEGDMVKNARYTMAPRADSISLVVMDEFHHKMTVIALNRNTVAKIRKYSLNGIDRGLFNDLLCYAYTYGDGGEVSCESLCEAVSEMLYGIPINGYVISNRSSLPVLADTIGPVLVTVPNNDLAEADPILTEGALASIDASNLELFVRVRDIDVDFSNVGRMQRQQAYINGAMSKIRRMMENSPAELWNAIQGAENCLQTNITHSRYLDLTKVLKNTSYDEQDYYIPAGELVMDGKISRFYSDEKALLDKVIEIFYIKQ